MKLTLFDIGSKSYSLSAGRQYDKSGCNHSSMNILCTGSVMWLSHDLVCEGKLLWESCDAMHIESCGAMLRGVHTKSDVPYTFFMMFVPENSRRSWLFATKVRNNLYSDCVCSWLPYDDRRCCNTTSQGYMWRYPLQEKSSCTRVDEALNLLKIYKILSLRQSFWSICPNVLSEGQKWWRDDLRPVDSFIG